MHTTLTIRHQGENNGQVQFVVTRLSDGKTSEPVSLTAPDKITLPNRGNSHLANDLRWYLERFLDYPFEPNIGLAKGIQDALDQWGKDTFSNLFQGKARDWYQNIKENNLNQLTLKIASDNPRVLAWPWEALHDPEGTTLAHTCHIERQLNELHDSQPLPDNLSTDCINILLVTIRPHGDQDVGYHALARPLIELSQEQTVPMRVDVLRPPTFDQFRDALKEKPGFYHIVHFNGYGCYGNNAESRAHKGYQGKLIFETEEGKADAIGATQLAQLLSEYNIPITVLNASQSVGLDEQADDALAFDSAAIAAALLKAGIRSVVAMNYNLTISAAQQFVPAFYRSLFEQGSVEEATCAGRQAMLAHPQRVCARGEYPLQDWLVPVLYQQAAYDLNFTAASQPQATNIIPLPPAAMEQGDYGFINRDRAIHALEQALRQQPQAGLLIHGIAGVGKTSLAQGFVQWLQQTNGLKKSIFWFRFDEIRNIEYIINQMVQGLFGTDALASSMHQKMDNLCAVFKQNTFIMVWDNFECASGIENTKDTEGTEVAPLLTDDDRKQLKEFLHRLRNGKTKVIITSRSSETWLSATECTRLPLSGLQGEECWQYCNALVRGLGLTLDRDDSSYNHLMKKLDGHPLAMRVVLLKLEQTPAATLLQELEQGFDDTEQDESIARTDAALGLLETSFPPEYTAVLQFIGLHQRYVQLNTLTDMMKNSDLATGQITIKDCISVLERAGLMHSQQEDMYAIHPALNEYLRRHHPAETAVQGAFVDLMGHFADHLAPKVFHEQRAPFFIHSANFHYALSLAITLDMAGHVTALTQSLAVFALNNRDFQGAARLFENLANHYHQHNDDEGIASCYHQLGRIAQEQRNFVHAEQWYLRSLAIKENEGDEHGSANTYAQLGALQRAQHHWVAAAQWFIKAATIFNNSNDTHAVARVAKVYVALLQQSDAQYQDEIKQLWQQSGLEQAVDSLDMLIEESNKIEKTHH
jgi:CHAT domain-containing protein/NB-ARC domain-containing protein